MLRRCWLMWSYTITAYTITQDKNSSMKQDTIRARCFILQPTCHLQREEQYHFNYITLASDPPIYEVQNNPKIKNFHLLLQYVLNSPHIINQEPATYKNSNTRIFLDPTTHNYQISPRLTIYAHFSFQDD